MTAADMIDAIKEQKLLAAAGSIGTVPMDDGQQDQYTLKVMRRLTDEAEFRDIVVQTNTKGGIVRLDP